MNSPALIFNYDISCPFAYLASTRIAALAARTNASLVYRPVLLGAIYRATAAPQGAGGSASDVYNPAKKAITAAGMRRTITRSGVELKTPREHPRRTVGAVRMLYCVDGEERMMLTEALFRAYWVEGRDVSDENVLLEIVRESGIKSASSISKETINSTCARKELETATAEALDRGAFGVPGFWIPDISWMDFKGKKRQGRYLWGQDRMHFVEATLLSLQSDSPFPWSSIPALYTLIPRHNPTNTLQAPTQLEFWFDFSSTWSFIGYTQLPRLQRTFPDLQIVMRPFLLGVLFRDIGVPNVPIQAVSKSKARWTRQDVSDWAEWWNAVNVQEGEKDREIEFHWTDHFPLRTPTVLRVALVEPKTVEVLYSACWEKNENVSDESVLADVLNKAGFNATELIKKAKTPEMSQQLRANTAEAKEKGLCGAPSYRVLRQDGKGEWKPFGGVIWGQDQMSVVEDLIAGCDDGEVREKVGAKL